MAFEDNSFDVVWSYAVWEHIPHPKKAFYEVIRVIVEGWMEGVIYAIEYTKGKKT